MLLIKNLRIFYNIICSFNALPLNTRLFSINTKSSVMRIFFYLLPAYPSNLLMESL